MVYVKVAIDNNSRHTDSLYTYRAEDGIPVGSVVTVTFGRGARPLRAFVFETGVKAEIDEARIKDIISVDPVIRLSGEAVKTALWMRSRYGIRYAEAARCFIAPGKPPKEGKEKRPLRLQEGEPQDIEALTDEQELAMERIIPAIDGGRQRNFLIHGVTGSGKTEIYMQAIARVIAGGRTAIMLVPEIALTKQITERFIGRFGREKLAILHSKLTKRERFDEWARIASGEARIVIGARMAVFAPCSDIGLIVMDEEHESTYKADRTPNFETVDIALKRLMYWKGVLIMGSATPSVVSYQRAREGIYELIELKERYNGVKLPKIDIIDMREELRSGNRGFFSGRLYKAVRAALGCGSQVILFLNRRGYSTRVMCRDCGHIMKCPECGITLTYHKSENRAVCHYCGRRFRLPAKCPECGSALIKYAGTGTEQVEERAGELFPGAAVDRLDLDTAVRASSAGRILNDFARGRTDILVGTQLVAKGLDFRNVGLVGVIDADTSLSIPDYRSTERTFQLITQVAGRAGRGDDRGLVLVQTYDPDNFAVKCAAASDYRGFFNEEISFRRMMGYPPFTDLILVEFTSPVKQESLDRAEECMRFIASKKVNKQGDEIYAPRVSTYFKGNSGGSVRCYILIKSPRGLRNEYIYHVRRYIDRLTASDSGCSVVIDVNPYSTF